MPDVSFHTLQLPVSEQFPCWKETVCEQFMSLECQVKQLPGSFDASVNVSSFLDYGLANIKADAHTVTRSTAMMSRDHKSCYYINYQKAGQCLVTDHRGKQKLVQAGEAFIVSSSEYFQMAFDNSFEHFVIEVPHAEIKGDGLRSGTHLTPKKIEDRLLLGAISIFEKEHAHGMEHWPREIFLNQCASLLNVRYNLKNNQDGYGHLSEDISERIKANTIKEYINTHLSDSKLSVESISSHFNCSRRTIYRCFEKENISVSQYIGEKRIELSKKILMRFPDISILEVCYRCGFEDSSNFSKKFKKYTNQSPREYRNSYIGTSD